MGPDIDHYLNENLNNIIVVSTEKNTNMGVNSETSLLNPQHVIAPFSPKSTNSLLNSGPINTL